MLGWRALDLRLGPFRLTADLALPGAGFIAMIGPSGAGKSTLLAATAGFVAPQAGRILWRGRDISGLPPGQRPVSILFQDGNLFPHLTLAQNLGLALAPRLRPTPAIAARVAGMMDQLGISDLAGRRPDQVSGGQAARAALARVLLADRPVILMDEPFAALGPALRQEMLILARDQAQAAGRLVVMVTHSPQDARAVADHLVVVADGAASGPLPVGATLDDPPPALAAYLGRAGGG